MPKSFQSPVGTHALMKGPNLGQQLIFCTILINHQKTNRVNFDVLPVTTWRVMVNIHFSISSTFSNVSDTIWSRKRRGNVQIRIRKQFSRQITVVKLQCRKHNQVYLNRLTL